MGKPEKKHTIASYRKRYGGAPWDDRELAEHIQSHLDLDLPLAKAASEFLEAMNRFDNLLSEAGIDRG